MKLGKLLLSAAVISALTITGLSATAYAWHPDGKITKKVQNVTTGSALSEADTAGTAIAAKPGDTLKYVIEVRNDGQPSENGHNDLASIVMKDNLPDGIQLASNPSLRQISENYDLIKPSKKMTWEYLVKVTATKEGAITNTACFTGNSTVNDSPQQGCNPAVVKVTIPPVPPTPEEPKVPVTPTTPKAPETPVELPKTGTTENILGSAIVLGLIAYLTHHYVNSRRELKTKTIA